MYGQRIALPSVLRFGTWVGGDMDGNPNVGATTIRDALAAQRALALSCYQSDLRALPGVWIAGDAMHDMIGKRKPILTAKRMLSNQTFRDLYKADNLNIDQRLKITSLTFLFTDLKGSTALYERVGDLAAFDLVRAHFHALLEIIAAEKGAVVKTIGDAVMATFIRPEHALQAGLRMRSAMKCRSVPLSLRPCSQT